MRHLDVSTMERGDWKCMCEMGCFFGSSVPSSSSLGSGSRPSNNISINVNNNSNNNINSSAK
jgi:hypothetical protein